MHPNTTFVKDWLQIHIDFFDLSFIHLDSHETTLLNKYELRAMENSDIAENTKATFTVLGKRLCTAEKILMDVPKCIEIKYFYEALSLLNSEIVNTNIQEFV